LIWKIIVVALTASVEIYVAIGIGMVAKLSPTVICAATLTGGVAGVFAAAFLGERIKAWLSRFKKEKPQAEPQKDNFKTRIVKTLQTKYGEFGVGFLSTFIVGAPIAMGIGITLGIAPKQLIKWCLLAVVIRSIVYSYFFDFVKNLF
jgi:hypothetical protein